MKLLLDEHFSPAIAEQLRKRGHDVIAAAAMPELRHRDDAEVLVWATAQRRAVVTEDAADYVALHVQHLSRAIRHRGIVLTNGRGFPRSRAGVGRLVRALDGLLRSRPGDGSLTADVLWLWPNPSGDIGGQPEGALRGNSTRRRRGWELAGHRTPG